MAILTASSDAAAGAQFVSTVQNAGVNVGALGQLAQLQLAVSQLYNNIPGPQTITGALSLLSSALSSSPAAGIGYGTGAGGLVTQASNRSTNVTLNTVVGSITGNATSLAASTSASFTVVNSAVAATDIVLLSVVSGPTANTSIFHVAATGTGSFVIRAANVSTSAGDVGAPVIAFAVLKGVTA